MLKGILIAIFMIFLIVFVGSLILDIFPQLQPLWDEFTFHLSNLYESSMAQYGSIITILIIIAVVILIGTSSGNNKK